MATIRRSGSGWQALIRKKEYVGPKAKTFRSRAQAQLWANAVEGALKRPKSLDQQPPQFLKDAIDLFMEHSLIFWNQKDNSVTISSISCPFISCNFFTATFQSSTKYSRLILGHVFAAFSKIG